jgi:Kef-type K+ transport system membrane component KefB
VIIVACCKGLYVGSTYEHGTEPLSRYTPISAHGLHLEVLLPAFVVGCVLKHQHEGELEKTVATGVSAVFMLFVGLSTPPLTFSGDQSVFTYLFAGHIFAITVLMVLGKMFPCVCYRDEADWMTRLALSLGMCPRGEVGAGIIVISIEAGIKGPAIELAVVCLVINLVLSGAFVTWTKQLARSSERRVRLERERQRREALERAARRTKAKATEAMFATAVAAFWSHSADHGSKDALLKITLAAWKDAAVLLKRRRAKKKAAEEKAANAESNANAEANAAALKDRPRRSISMYLEGKLDDGEEKPHGHA